MYHENNIDFRIASADALGKFKTIQAHSFLQVCRKEFEFDISSREVLLLCYEKFSDWLMKMERVFLLEEKALTRAAVDIIISTFKIELMRVEEICQENSRVFSSSIIEYLKIIHRYSALLMNDGINSLYGHPARAFSELSSMLSDYLQHILISMHEYNNNLILKKDPFICISRFCILQRTVNSGCSLISLRSRAEFFRTKLVDKKCEFLLKNYTEEKICDESIVILSSIDIFAKDEILAEEMVC